MAFGERVWTIRHSPDIPAEKLQVPQTGGAESGALSDRSPSPALSVLAKLAAGLSAAELATLARLLQ
jgi:hypothetical protein